jgi:nucleotide-binding universal stress UspA family protein
MSFRKILFPVDFSEQCTAVAPYIADIANRFLAKLDLLHVVEDSTDLDMLCSRRRDELMAFARSIPGGMHCSQAVIYGNPAQRITSYAEEQTAGLIAMPTSGKGTLRRWSIGSTTQKVLRQASCAVWTESGTGLPHVRWSPILCAIDLNDESEHVLSYAAGLAELLQVHLVVVHAIPPLSEALLMHPLRLPPALSHAEAQRAIGRLLQDLNLLADPIAEMAPVVDAVSRVASQIRAKLLVIGRGGDSGRAVGSHLYELVRNAPCPVLTCPNRAARAHSFWTEWQQENDSPVQLYTARLAARKIGVPRMANTEATRPSRGS